LGNTYYPVYEISYVGQICGYCTDVLTEGFQCWFSQDRLWFYPSRR